MQRLVAAAVREDMADGAEVDSKTEPWEPAAVAQLGPAGEVVPMKGAALCPALFV